VFACFWRQQEEEIDISSQSSRMVIPAGLYS
jgi:hypothetical protein